MEQEELWQLLTTCSSAVYSTWLVPLVGTLGVTMVCNVPLNDALATVKPESTDGANLWASYLTDWTLWNHVRTVSALAAAALFTIALGNDL
jgi:uncharacterized membrane protein